MLAKFFIKIADIFINFLTSWFEALKFSGICMAYLLRPKSYNPAMTSVLIKQIYFTTWQLLPLFFTLAFLFGSIIVGVVIYISVDFGLQNQIGSIITTAVVKEIAPLFTALLIALRSGAAVNTEIAVMNINKEIAFLKQYNIDIYSYLYLPRIISGVFSAVTLSVLFAIIVIFSGYLFVFFLLGMDFNTYTMLIFNALGVNDFMFLFIKSIVYGFVIMLIPIYSGMTANDQYTQIPISVLNGMMKLFIAIFFVEVCSLAVQFI